MRAFPYVRGSMIVLGAILAMCGGAGAHHGSAEYTTDKLVVLKHATVTRFLWANPHSLVLFDVKDGNGSVTHWAAEAGSPAAIRPLGWTKSSLRAGDAVIVALYPSKFDSSFGRVDKIVLADGTTLKNAPRTDRGDANRY